VNPHDLPGPLALDAPGQEATSADLLGPLLRGATQGGTAPAAEPIHGVVIGDLLALSNNGNTPLVRYPGQRGEAAVPAQSTVDLHGAHIGRRVVLMFEEADGARPIVMGVLREAAGWPLAELPAQVDVDADGQRLVVTAQEQLVLRCGKASITLTKAGKVLVEGSYLLSRSTGVNRVKGGSVQLN
jgi:Domain of unknown function (DUF6484)